MFEYNISENNLATLLKSQELTLGRLMEVIEVIEVNEHTSDSLLEESYFWLIKLHYHKIYKKHCEYVAI